MCVLSLQCIVQSLKKFLVRRTSTLHYPHCSFLRTLRSALVAPHRGPGRPARRPNFAHGSAELCGYVRRPDNPRRKLFGYLGCGPSTAVRHI